jgi:hypothetical protein
MLVGKPLTRDFDMAVVLQLQRIQGFELRSSTDIPLPPLHPYPSTLQPSRKLHFQLYIRIDKPLKYVGFKSDGSKYSLPPYQ